METQSSLNLNESLDKWRHALNSQGLKPEDIEELEGHLLETVQSLESTGLSSSEACLVAQYRLGRPEILREQFQLASLSDVWKERGLWMLAGVLLFWLLTGFANLASLSALIIGNRWTDNGFLLGGVGLAGQAVTFFLFGLLLWQGAKSRSFFIANRPSFAKMYAGLLAGVIILRLCGLIFSSWAVTINSPRTLGGFYTMVSGYSAPLLVIGLGAFGGWLCWKVRSKPIIYCGLLCGSFLLSGCGPKESRPQAAQTPSAQSSATSATSLERTLQLAKDDAGKAADEFMKVDLTSGSVFSPGSPLSYSEAQFIKLPREVNEKLAQQAQNDLAALKKIVVEVRARRDQARAAGKADLAQRYNSHLEKLAERLEGPSNLAIAQMVGKGIRKIAAQ